MGDKYIIINSKQFIPGHVTKVKPTVCYLTPQELAWLVAAQTKDDYDIIIKVKDIRKQL